MPNEDGLDPRDAGLLARWRGWAPELLSVFRIVTAYMFIQYGTGKLFAFPGPLMPDGGTAPLTSLAGVASVIEVVGGALLLVGLFTRPVAFIVAGEMAVAYWYGHAPMGTWYSPVLNMGVPAVLYCFAWLYISAAGGGPWSLDALRHERVAMGPPGE